jgi:hypothetical protein
LPTISMLLTKALSCKEIGSTYCLFRAKTTTTRGICLTPFLLFQGNGFVSFDHD